MKLPITLLTLAALSFHSLAQEESLTPIFNGRNLDGWNTDDALVASHWLISDGQIIGDNPDKKGSVLWTKANYNNYELNLYFQTDSPDYDSGVFVRGPSHQVQIGVSRSLKIDLTAAYTVPKIFRGNTRFNPTRSKRRTSWVNGTH